MAAVELPHADHDQGLLVAGPCVVVAVVAKTKLRIPDATTTLLLPAPSRHTTQRQPPVAMNGYPPPMGAPISAWRAVKTADGKEYYHNAATNATTWDKPDELKDEVEVRCIHLSSTE